MKDKKETIEMRKMAKFASLALVGAMVFSMPVMAKEVGAPVAVYLESDSDIGDPAETVAAIKEDKLIGEHMNNAVTGIWAMDKVTPIAQGGDIIIDGEKTNVTFILQKPELSRVYSAKDYAKAVGGTVLNVVKIDTHVGFGTANVNFYMPGVVGTENIHVLQFNGDSWTDLNVTEIRADHVVADLTSTGTFAFIVEP